ncbi:MAG: bifunctional (p)ppGpp synthetase/guanosine-3',5'-bis(diphosphate) 3'-pyrophosphohydrolase [Bacteriovoracales bacterium]|nr:bifunctional (p)ppGpp synthetase/guanosine-3',5'-bis(diphosphate) 3'-pyrophosphohydrolase [Bacteriovoracales bacterium]
MQKLDFSHEGHLDIETLLKRVKAYYPDADFITLRKAYQLAEKAHSGQKRSSGEPYIIHPLNVAAILIKLRMDTDTIIAGILHDSVEDCDVSPRDIEEKVNPTVAQLVVGLTKISKIKFKTRQEHQVENFRRMVVAMAKDIRVIIIKLADRMHNMRTLQYVNMEKQQRIANETLEIYVPLASRLGIHSVKSELEDLCLRFSRPETYYRLAEKVAMKKEERDVYIKETIELVQEKLLEFSVKAEVRGRPKHFYSIYKKMRNRGVDFEQIQDLLAFRVLVGNITECYKVLGIIHSSFKPIPGRFKDYIAIPKVNNYQALHTTVIGPRGNRIEIQIRTQEMEEVAETGVAAHWKYKEGIMGAKQKLDWVQELLDISEQFGNDGQFMNVVKSDLDIGGIFIFTPVGDVKELQHGSTPLDFAYSIHTEVGHRCVGAKVNGKIVPLRYKLKSGDMVEVLTSKTQTPSKDWLNLVKSSKAKAKIKQWLLKVERERSRELGEKILEKAFRVYGTSLAKALKKGLVDQALKHFRYSIPEELYVHTGVGKLSAKDVIDAIPELIPKVEEEKSQELDKFSSRLTSMAQKTSRKNNAVIVDGMDDLMVRMGKCCNPIPGDIISGHITRGRGITVHREDCQRLGQAESTRIITVSWNSEYFFKHPVGIRVMTNDRPGVLSTISKAINETGINIRSAIATSLPDAKGSFIFQIEVRDYSEFLKAISAIESVSEVISVNRV